MPEPTAAAKIVHTAAATPDTLRDQLEFLISQVERGLASNSELRRFSFISFQLLKPFEDKP
jgi:hypothetical protein